MSNPVDRLSVKDRSHEPPISSVVMDAERFVTAALTEAGLTDQEIDEALNSEKVA